MKKSFTRSHSSKKNSAYSFLSLKDQCNIQMIRISLKKQGDRKQRLQSLLQRFIQIRGAQKKHMKTIKANIIELKDIPTIAKLNFFLDPSIYVDNNLSVETREFLCLLLNTFYERYRQNEQIQKKGNKIVQNIKHLIKGISHNQQLLFQIQKMNINQQVQTQAQIFKQKNRLREQNNRTPGIQNEKNRILAIWNKHKYIYLEQKQKSDRYKQTIVDLNQIKKQILEKIHHGEQIREGNRQKLTGQMAYHIKFDEQGKLLKQSILFEEQRQKKLKKMIKDKQRAILKLKKQKNIQNINHKSYMTLINSISPTESSNITCINQLQKHIQNNQFKSVHLLPIS